MDGSLTNAVLPQLVGGRLLVTDCPRINAVWCCSSCSVGSCVACIALAQYYCRNTNKLHQLCAQAQYWKCCVATWLSHAEIQLLMQLQVMDLVVIELVLLSLCTALAFPTLP